MEIPLAEGETEDAGGYAREQGEDFLRRQREHLGKVTRQPGFLTREELVARYEDGSGRSMDNMRWYMTLAIWKSIVFMEGNYKRATSGATDDPYLKQFGDGVIELANGCYLMLVEEFRPTHVRSLPEVRDEIEKTLLLQERGRLYRQWIDRLKAKSFVIYFPLAVSL